MKKMITCNADGDCPQHTVREREREKAKASADQSKFYKAANLKILLSKFLSLANNDWGTRCKNVNFKTIFNAYRLYEIGHG